MDYIRLKKDNVYRLGIKDRYGNSKLDKDGNEVCLEFDLEDIETPMKYNQCVIKIKKAKENLNNQYIIINKKQDVKSKNGFMSKNEEAKYNAIKQFYKELEEAIDLFIGEGGTNKVFGSRRYITMWDDFNEMIEPFLPKIKINLDEIEKKIKTKYSIEDNEVLKDE